jgi:hypothetical protein
MAAEDVKDPKSGAHASSTAPKAGSPTDALTAALAAAEKDFREHRDGDPRVMVAFGLGWQMAEIYRPDRRHGSTPAAADDLPGISRFSAADLQEMGLFQVQAGITKLQDSICDAGLEVPDAQRFAEHIRSLGDRQRRRAEIREFHINLLSTLTAADFRLGKAYGLGRALADTTRLPPDWQAELKTHRVGTLAGWIRELSSALPPHAAHPVPSRLRRGARGRRHSPATAAIRHASSQLRAVCGAACCRAKSSRPAYSRAATICVPARAWSSEPGR